MVKKNPSEEGGISFETYLLKDKEVKWWGKHPFLLYVPSWILSITAIVISIVQLL